MLICIKSACVRKGLKVFVYLRSELALVPEVWKIISKMEIHNERKFLFLNLPYPFEALFSENMKYEMIVN